MPTEINFSAMTWETPFLSFNIWAPILKTLKKRMREDKKLKKKDEVNKQKIK